MSCMRYERYENDRFTVDLIIDKTYSLNSADNRHYDVIFDPENIQKERSFGFYKPILISYDDLYNDDRTDILIIAGDEHWGMDAVLDDERIIVLNENVVYIIDLAAKELVFRKELDIFPCVYRIFLIHGDRFLIWDETAVTCLGMDFEKLWTINMDGCIDSIDFFPDNDLSVERIQLKSEYGKKVDIDINGNEITKE